VLSLVAPLSCSGPAPADPAVETNAAVQAIFAEHATLRRVATLAAHAVSNKWLLAAVSEELARLAGADAAALLRFEPHETITLLAAWNAAGVPVAVGDQQPVNAALRRLRDSVRPIRCGPTDVPLTGPFIAEIRKLAIRATVAVPIQVDGRVRGASVVASQSPEPFPASTEARMVKFAELVATAIGNPHSRAKPAASRARLIAAADIAAADNSHRQIQPDLRDGRRPRSPTDKIPTDRTPVATRADQVRSEVNQLAGVRLDDVERIAERSVARTQDLLPSCARVPAEELLAVTLTNTRNLLEAVRDPDADPTRAEDHFRVSGETQVHQAIAADEMLQAWRIELEVVREEAHPAARHLGIADDALLDFVEATLQWGDVGMRKSASAYREAEIRELERLAEEQAALRRVATLVAEGAPPSAVFDAVATEMAKLLVADGLTLVRYEPDDELTVLAHRGVSAGQLPAGTRVRHGGASVSATVRRTQRPARMASYADTHGQIGEVIGELRFRSGVGAPIVVDGRLWDATIANWTAQEPPAPGTEQRLAEFARLLDTAIANADSRDQLTASRTRLVSEAHEARRRVVRDLHDGAQQGLVHTIIALKLVRRALDAGQPDLGPLVSEALQYAEAANDELRELVHGILPSVLTREGLRAGVDELAGRMSIPVEIDIGVDRLPAVVEATAYFVVAGALTNVVKHAHAEHAEVRASVTDETLHLEVRDDGMGGADPRGHALVGLSDRVAALDGRLSVESPALAGRSWPRRCPSTPHSPTGKPHLAGAVPTWLPRWTTGSRAARLIDAHTAPT